MSPDEANDVRLSWGPASLSARGFAAVVVLCVGMVLVVLGYFGHRLERSADAGFAALRDEFARDRRNATRQLRDHQMMIHDNRVLQCILSLPQETRNQLRQYPAIAWDLWCPGIMRTPSDREGTE